MTKEKILVVDDSDTQRNIYKSLLAEEGYSLFEAKDGEEGLSLAKSVLPDVIVTDLHMPKMDGFEMITKMRADAELKYVPIICVTATYQDLANKIRALTEAGAEEYFYSPGNNEEFIAKVYVMMRIRKVYLDLLQKNKDLKLFNDAAVDREMKMVELKQKIKKLEEQLGKK